MQVARYMYLAKCYLVPKFLQMSRHNDFVFVEVLSIAIFRICFACILQHLEYKNGRDFLCSSHGTPSLIITLLDGHIVITTEII